MPPLISVICKTCCFIFSHAVVLAVVQLCGMGNQMREMYSLQYSGGNWRLKATEVGKVSITNYISTNI
jgi:hypothetical protein